MTLALRLAAFLLVGATLACEGGSGTPPPAVEHVPRAFFPRPETEDYWETIRVAEVGPRVLLHLHPRIKTPAEGPWMITFVDPSGRTVSEHPGLRVDTATGRFTFLATTAALAPGDWAIRLHVEEGGLVSGPRERVYRFRVE